MAGRPRPINKKIRVQLGHTLSAYADQRGWDQSTFARHTERGGPDGTGVSQTFIGRLQHAGAGCSLDILYELGRALRVPYWQLLIPNRAASPADPHRLEALVLAYLNGDATDRAALDRIAANIETPTNKAPRE